jgi:polar amino acid transport system substrate-binding protein
MALRRHRLTTTVLSVVPLVAVLALSGCGGDDSSSNGSDAASADSSAPLFDKLPAEIQDAGTINIGSSIDYPPFEYYAEDGKTLKGFEVELADLLEKQLGVTFTWNNAGFDTLLPALSSNRYDLIYGATNDTAEREADYDFVYYLQSSQGFVTQAGNPEGIETVDDLCGKAIAAVRGGVQAEFLTNQSDTCEKSGQDPIDILTFDGNSQEQLAVRQGKAAALLENFPTAAVFAQESDGVLELVDGLQVEKQFFGMVLQKDDTELRDALVDAWNGIIEDGSYDEVLKNWNLDDIAVDKAGINAVATNAKP